MVIGGYEVGRLVKGTAREVMNDNVLGLAAQTAYYFFFSLFPIFLFLTPLLAIVGDPRRTFEYLLGQLQGAVPPDAFALMRSVIEQVVFEPNAPGLVSIGALLALWSGSNVFNALGGALNDAYGVEQGRPWWKQRLVSIACLLGVGLLFITSTIVVLAGGNIVDAIAVRLGISDAARVAWTVAQYGVALGLLVATAAAIYYFLPNVRQRRAHVFVAGTVATLLWVVVTLGFRLYVQNFGNYNATYGAIGGVIVLLTWMYLSMLMLLIGGELASELHRGTGAVGAQASTGKTRRATDRVVADGGAHDATRGDALVRDRRTAHGDRRMPPRRGGEDASPSYAVPRAD